MTFPRYCTNDDYLLGEPCRRYGEKFESGSDCKKTRGHGPRYRCPSCGKAVSPTPPEGEHDG